MGVRPSSIALTEDRAEGAGEGEVYAYEYFGNEAIVTIQTAEQLLKVKLAGSADRVFAIGDRVCFRFESEHCHYFASEVVEAGEEDRR